MWKCSALAGNSVLWEKKRKEKCQGSECSLILSCLTFTKSLSFNRVMIDVYHIRLRHDDVRSLSHISCTRWKYFVSKDYGHLFCVEPLEIKLVCAISVYNAVVMVIGTKKPMWTKHKSGSLPTGFLCLHEYQ